MISIMFGKIYVSIRKWFQPYWNPRPKITKVKQKKKQESQHNTVEQSVKILRSKHRLERLWNSGKAPSVGKYWFFHDVSHHEVGAYLSKDTAFTFTERNDKERSELKPLIYPRMNVAYDRTQLIPFGYHGIENNSALVIGWSSSHNRNELRNFEIEMNKENKTRDLVWFTYVTRKPEFGIWTYRVYDAGTRKMVGELTLKLKCGDFVWK